MLPADVTCFRCKHFKKDVPKWSCAAFPNGIPKKIIYGEPPAKGCNNGKFKFEPVKD